MPAFTDQTRLIDNQPSLDELCDSLSSRSGETIACDTEFVRTQTYWPGLCVIQLAWDNRHAGIDLLTGLDANRFFDELLSHGRTIVFHAAKQDLEAIYAIHERMPDALFDTQIAAGLLGYQPQIGYAGLVKDMLGVELPKDQTRTDWSRRPLSEAQIQYALDDVFHLGDVYALAVERLESDGRIEWAREDSAALLNPRLYFTPANEAWKRIGSIPYMPEPIQARAIRLAGWREDRARQADRPRQWILPDKAITAIAHANPVEPDELNRIEELPPAVVRKQGAAIVAACQQANTELAGGNWELHQQAVPEPPDREKIKQLSTIVSSVADELGIAQEILATRKDIAGILNGAEDVRPLSGWRRAIVGDRLLAAL